MKPHTVLSLLLLSLGLLIPWPLQAEENPQFTDWMPNEFFNKFMDETGKKDAKGKNFWDRGHRLTAVECKWEDGWQYYRVAIGKSPKGKASWWMWYLGMDQKSFENRLGSLGKDGYQLVQMNVSESPSGIKSYAGVWHKVKEKDAPNPQAAAQTMMEEYEKPAPEAGGEAPGE